MTSISSSTGPPAQRRLPHQAQHRSAGPARPAAPAGGTGWTTSTIPVQLVFGATCRLGYLAPRAIATVNSLASRALSARTYTAPRTRCSPARAGSGSRSRNTRSRGTLADARRGARPVRPQGLADQLPDRKGSGSRQRTTCGSPPPAAGTAPTSRSTCTTPRRMRSTSATPRRS